jgi:hypothetical protein
MANFGQQVGYDAVGHPLYVGDYMAYAAKGTVSGRPLMNIYKITDFDINHNINTGRNIKIILMKGEHGWNGHKVETWIGRPDICGLRVTTLVEQHEIIIPEGTYNGDS